MPAVNGVHFKRCWLLNSSNVNKFNAVEFSKSRNIQASSTAMNFRDCIIGPGLDSFMDMPNVGNSKVSVNGGLFINPTRNSTPIPDKFAMANTTTFTAYPNASCLNTQGVPNISNSIFYGGIVSVSNANSLLGPANFQFKTTGNTTVLSRGQVDPKFTSDVSKITPLVSKHGEISISEKRAYVVRLALLDFALQGKSPAKGSGAHVTSIKQLLSVNSP